MKLSHLEKAVFFERVMEGRYGEVVRGSARVEGSKNDGRLRARVGVGWAGTLPATIAVISTFCHFI